jgi:hypothetical protein
MPPLKRTYNGGLNTAADRGELAGNEMTVATGVYYKPGDPLRAHKLPGRSTFGDTSSAAKVGGIALCQFDSGGTDLLLALSSGTLYKATPGATGTWSSLYSLSGAGASLDAAHVNDRWLLAMDSENRVLKSDGTVRGMGMIPPAEGPALTYNGSTGTVSRPDTDTASFTNPGNAYDTDAETFADGTLSSATSVSETWSYSSGSTGTSRTLYVSWSVTTAGGGTFWDWTSFFGWDLGAKVSVKIELSENGGTSFTEIMNATLTDPQAPNVLNYPVADATALTSAQIKVTLTYTAGTKAVSLRIQDIRIQDAPAATVSWTNLTYAFTEYDEDEGLESAPSAPIGTGAQSSKVAVNVGLPAAALNSNATHYNIYRTPDQGTNTQLGWIARVPVSQTTFPDDFTLYDKDTQPSRLIQYIQVEVEGAVEHYYRDEQPPNLRRVTHFRGSSVGLSDVNRRAIFYSQAGFPESYPAINIISKVPLDEHDEFLDLEEIAGSLIVAAKGAIVRIDELPRSVAGTFVATPPTPIKGAPGCVGDKAMAKVNYKGRSFAAWISPEDGVLITDGHEWRPVTNDLDWSAFDGFTKTDWVLDYLKHLRALVLCYSSTASGTNDRYYLLHLSDRHIKRDGSAKVTGPHYGAINALTSGVVSASTRVYSAHTSDGKVYVEMNTATGADSSNAYNTDGDWPLIITGPRRYENWMSYSALDARLYHTDFGTSQTCTVGYEVGREASGESSTRSQSVSLSGHGATQFDVARAGGWHQETITHTGTGTGAIAYLQVNAAGQGKEGKQAVTA